MKKGDSLFLVAFLGIEALLYCLVLTTGGTLLRWSSFGSILLCFLFSFLHCKQGNRWIISALALTVMADFFLVAIFPVQRLWGMVCFFCVQTVYAVMLTRERFSRTILTMRIVAICMALLCVVLVLGDKTDPLAIVSIIYYATLILNILHAFLIPSMSVFVVALILFLLCDTVVGLQVVSDSYLSVAKDGLLHQLLFSGFNLAWFFYLPSQVLISLCSRKK